MERRREITDLIAELIGRDARARERPDQDLGLVDVITTLESLTAQQFGRDVKSWVAWFCGPDGPPGQHWDDLGATRRRIARIEAEALRRLGRNPPDDVA